MNKKLLVALCMLPALPLLALVALRVFFFEPFRIPQQNGMYPSFAAGAYLIAEKRPYASVSEVARGDVVVFVRQQDGNAYNYIWRVVGLPGDAIRVEGEQVLVNGTALPHEKVRSEGAVTIVREKNGPASYLVAYDDGAPREQREGADLVVGPGQVFVLGDNRYNAFDSTDFGPIEFGSIIARARK